TSTCEIDQGLKDKMRQFRFSKSSSGDSAIVMKIDKEKLIIIEEEEVNDIESMEELVELLPENTPRYVALSQKVTHADGRETYPLIFIFWAPASSSPELLMLYTTAKMHLQATLDIGRV
ncbi:glia maturation factor beta, partial [Hesseltinella vesiculosa]